MEIQPATPQRRRGSAYAQHTNAFPMRALEMNGCYPLDDAAIDEVVQRTSPGNYALGYMDGATFTVFYVGRSDSDVKRRLHEWVDTPSRCARYAPPTRAPWGFHPRGRLPHGAPVLDLVGNTADAGYTRFAYSYAGSAEAAFEKECRNFHDFGGSDGLDNEADPEADPEADRAETRVLP